METPTISKKQEKKTLSGKKFKKETIKNVLAKPYKNYWPLLTPEDNNHLKETLTKLLPKLKNEKVIVPYKEIKGIPKGERKKFRQTYAKLDPLELNGTDVQNLIFGVNDVSRLLENEEAGSVLIASDVEPRLFVQHVLDQAVLYNVPVLVVAELREILKNKCGVSGAVIGLKKTVKPDGELGIIQQTICNVYENYPVPETHINYNRRCLQETSAIVISDTEDNNRSVICISESENESETSRKQYHLRRESNRKRVFVPDESRPSAKLPTFISLDSSNLNATVVNTNKKKYRPLRVKKVKGDKNRNKRKMEKFKKKTKK